jgi:hypothetical protein
MTDSEIERRITKYKTRKSRFVKAIDDGAIRGNMPYRAHGGRCAMCNREDHVGGLCSFQLRDGNEMVVGRRCAEFLDYLIAHPARACSLLSVR